jgi:hypothetical protein
MTTRKDFLAAGAALSALAPQLAAAPLPAASATPAPMPHLSFDLAAFDAALNAPAKHRHLFSGKTADGDAFDTVRTVLDAYKSIAMPMNTVHPAAVLYHFAAISGLDDTVWNTLIIPNLAKLPKGLRDEVGALKAGTGNPSTATIAGLVTDANMATFVCNNAMTGLASVLAKASGADPVTTYATMSKHLVSNAMLVPAGVWAVHAVQEHGYSLLQVI